MRALNPMEEERALNPEIELFSTCPQSAIADRPSYLQNVIDVAHWSERAGCKGILVYSDNSQVDPWLLSQVIIQNTEHLCPLVAVQPIYMLPYTVAKMVATLGYLFRRRVYLNMVAGGFKNDLAALNDTTPHDQRYSRLAEYTIIINELLAGSGPVSYEGRIYNVENLKMVPPLDPGLFPGIFVSGSSEAGLDAARALGATAIHYPEPARTYTCPLTEDSIGHGIRIGIIARESEREAWQVAHAYFPEDRKGQLTQQLAMKVSDSVWHKQLSRSSDVGEGNPYWLVPFQNYKTFCPYLVGNYGQVAAELVAYIRAGMRTFILDIPKKEEDLRHISVVFRRALEISSSCQSYCRTG
jgi:alkanesulfonate monooxygenase